MVTSVRGGGHSAAGYGVNDGGLVIDLTRMRAVSVDPIRRTARAEGGALWNEFDNATQVHGLATTGGTVSNTGIGGLTLGGGIGWLSGLYGATVDNLIGARVVTADGEIRTASSTEYVDLFLAIRGGGGNFGVVTEFEYQLHAVGEVLGGLVLHPLAAAKEVLRFYRDVCPTLPDAAEINCGLLTSPDGMPLLGLMVGYNGPIAEGQKVMAPVRAFGRPVADTVTAMSYGQRQVQLDEPNAVHGLQRYWRSAFTEQLSDALIDVMVDGAGRFSSPMSALLMFYLHGAISRVDPAAMAFGVRKPQWDIDVIGQWAEPSESAHHISWLKELWSAMEGHLNGSTYLNHAALDDKPEAVRASFGAKYARLRNIKAKYDPDNLFRMNANIPPGR